MKAVAHGVATLRIQSTGETVHVTSDQLAWAAQDNDDRNRCAIARTFRRDEICHVAKVDVLDAAGQPAGTVTWRIFEFPRGVNEHHGHAAEGVEVVQDFKLILEPEQELAEA